MYAERGISRDKILIKVAATWEGVEAARQLQAEGIDCNLTLIFNPTQAIACAEAGAFLISPFVGRILDWYKARGQVPATIDEDPGVVFVRGVYAEFKRRGHDTVVMGASFRSTEQVLAHRLRPPDHLAGPARAAGRLHRHGRTPARAGAARRSGYHPGRPRPASTPTWLPTRWLTRSWPRALPPSPRTSTRSAPTSPAPGVTVRRVLLAGLLLGLAGWWYSTPRRADDLPVAAPAVSHHCPLPPTLRHSGPPLQSAVPDGLAPFPMGTSKLVPLAGFSLDGRVLSRRDYHSGREVDWSPTDLAWAGKAWPATRCSNASTSASPGAGTTTAGRASHRCRRARSPAAAPTCTSSRPPATSPRRSYRYQGRPTRADRRLAGRGQSRRRLALAQLHQSRGHRWRRLRGGLRVRPFDAVRPAPARRGRTQIAHDTPVPPSPQ